MLSGCRSKPNALAQVIGNIYVDAPQSAPDLLELLHAFTRWRASKVSCVQCADRCANDEIRPLTCRQEGAQHADLHRSQAPTARKHKRRLACGFVHGGPSPFAVSTNLI